MALNPACERWAWADARHREFSKFVVQARQLIQLQFCQIIYLYLIVRYDDCFSSSSRSPPADTPFPRQLTPPRLASHLQGNFARISSLRGLSLAPQRAKRRAICTAPAFVPGRARRPLGSFPRWLATRPEPEGLFAPVRAFPAQLLAHFVRTAAPGHCSLGIRPRNRTEAPAPDRLWKSLKRAFRLFPHTTVFHQEHSSQAKAIFSAYPQKGTKIDHTTNPNPYRTHVRPYLLRTHRPEIFEARSARAVHLALQSVRV